jgi:hypothetical protein
MASLGTGTWDAESPPSQDGSMDDKYTAAAVRQTWDVIAGRAFEEAGEVRLKAEDVRKFVSD